MARPAEPGAETADRPGQIGDRVRYRSLIFFYREDTRASHLYSAPSREVADF
jgi:hypothetical protein